MGIAPREQLIIGPAMNVIKKEQNPLGIHSAKRRKNSDVKKIHHV
jgi:hypothetical protein